MAKSLRNFSSVMTVVSDVCSYSILVDLCCYILLFLFSVGDGWLHGTANSVLEYRGRQYHIALGRRSEVLYSHHYPRRLSFITGQLLFVFFAFFLGGEERFTLAITSEVIVKIDVARL